MCFNEIKSDPASKMPVRSEEFSMNLERMRYAGRQLKLALALPCYFASLVLMATLFLPAESSSAQCTTKSNPNLNPNPESFDAVGDFNGDCKSDILWRNSTTEQVYIWLMNGTTFASNGSPGTPTSDWVIQGVGDFNGDGKSDILWRNSTTGEVYIWLMNGTTFTSNGSLGDITSDWNIAGVGDFNGDGKADILWQNSTTGQLYIWFMNGTTIAGGGSVATVSSVWNILGIGDFNGDGKADILWQNGATGQVYVWLMNGTTMASNGSPGTITPDWSIQGVGDFNGDGKSDILWQNSTTGQVYIWLMNGTTFASNGSPATAAPPQSVACANDTCSAVVGDGWSIQGVGDYDGSGRAGILWRQLATGQVYIWLMNGTTLTSNGSPGTPAPIWQIATLAPYGCSNQVLCNILSQINADRLNGPFPGTAAPWGPSTGTPNPAPSSEPGGALLPLTWDPGAATVAAAWVAGCSHTHNPNRDGGENMDFGEPVGSFNGTIAATGWDSEASNYVYPAGSGGCTPGDMTLACGHYSQDMWRTTTAIGCAVTQCPGSSNPFSDGNPWWYVICDFTPAGNYPQAPY
jgi:hypothetical protein